MDHAEVSSSGRTPTLSETRGAPTVPLRDELEVDPSSSEDEPCASAPIPNNDVEAKSDRRKQARAGFRVRQKAILQNEQEVSGTTFPPLRRLDDIATTERSYLTAIRVGSTFNSKIAFRRRAQEIAESKQITLSYPKSDSTYLSVVAESRHNIPHSDFFITARHSVAKRCTTRHRSAAAKAEDGIVSATQLVPGPSAPVRVVAPKIEGSTKPRLNNGSGPSSNVPRRTNAFQNPTSSNPVRGNAPAGGQRAHSWAVHPSVTIYVYKLRFLLSAPLFCFLPFLASFLASV